MPSKQRKYHFIYKITCECTGKYYYGMHSTDDLDDGYLGSGKRLRYSIRKYGKENHKKEILEFCKNIVDLKLKEEKIVNLNEITKKQCMNIVVGGNGGGIITDEHRKKSMERRAVLRKTNPEWIKKNSESISKGMKLAYEKGRRDRIYFCDWNGRTHTEETKKLISEKRKGFGIGEENSQYGTCWIYSDKLKENKKIKKENLYYYLNTGWMQGRKIHVNKRSCV